MHRLATYAAWLVGAIVPPLGFWYAVVYLFDDFDRQYGRDTWFLLHVYIAALATVVGLVGFIVSTFIRPRQMTIPVALVAGVAFSICHMLAVGALRHWFADRDMFSQQFAAALLLGALSALVATARAHA